MGNFVSNSGDFAPTLILGARPPEASPNAFTPPPERPFQPERMSFTGTGSEYFRIWIVNLLFTILTCGIYSAWAKVRRLRYFYNCTHVAGSNFEYHGNPVAILKGRIIAVLLIVAYKFGPNVAPNIGYMMMGIFALVMPWLTWKSLQFKLRNSSYRGIRFGFGGTLRRAYKVFFLYPFLMSFTGGLLAPFVHQRIKKFQHEESRFGTSNFSFSGKVGGFYGAYFVAIMIFIVGIFLLVSIMGGIIGAVAAGGGIKNTGAWGVIAFILIGLAFYAWAYLSYSTFMTMLQNLIWNNTMLENHQFKSEMKWTRVVSIAITNIIGIVLILGLFTPFAKIRMLKYRVESTTLIPAGSLDHFEADMEEEAPATGEAMTDLLDFDFAL